MSTYKNRKTAKKKYKGGKTTSDGNVPLFYNGKPIPCTICGANNYEEVIGTINKSKARTIVRNFFFGSDTGEIDNTSIITYFCNTCGYCVMIRNKDQLLITTATTNV